MLSGECMQRFTGQIRLRDVALVYNYEFPVGARETVLAAKAVLDSYRRKRPVALVL